MQSAGVFFENYISMISFDKTIRDTDMLTDLIISIVDDVNEECSDKGLHATTVRLTGHQDDGQSMLVRFLIQVGPVGQPAVSRQDVAELAGVVAGVK